MSDPWAFGWTQVLTSIGLCISVIVSILGLRTFGKWRREKLEERKMEIAFEALSIAYELKFVFEDIRARLVRSYESDDMPYKDISPQEAQRRSSFYAVMKRIGEHKDFFERVIVLLPKFLAVFGKSNEDVFLKVLQAKNHIHGACEVLMWDIPDPRRDNEEWGLSLQMRSDIWGHDSSGVKEPRRVTQMLEDFQNGIENVCRPFVDREFGKRDSWRVWLCGERQQS